MITTPRGTPLHFQTAYGTASGSSGSGLVPRSPEVTNMTEEDVPELWTPRTFYRFHLENRSGPFHPNNTRGSSVLAAPAARLTTTSSGAVHSITEVVSNLPILSLEYWRLCENRMGVFDIFISEDLSCLIAGMRK